MCVEKVPPENCPKLICEQQSQNITPKSQDTEEILALQEYYAEMPEEQFHKMMDDTPFIASVLCDPVFEIDGWENYCVEETCNISAEHRREQVCDGIQSASHAFVPNDDVNDMFCSVDVNIEFPYQCVNSDSESSSGDCYAGETSSETDVDRESEIDSDTDVEEYFTCVESDFETEEAINKEEEQLFLTKLLTQGLELSEAPPTPYLLQNPCEVNENHEISNPDVSIMLNQAEDHDVSFDLSQLGSYGLVNHEVSSHDVSCDVNHGDLSNDVSNKVHMIADPGLNLAMHMSAEGEDVSLKLDEKIVGNYGSLGAVHFSAYCPLQSIYADHDDLFFTTHVEKDNETIGTIWSILTDKLQYTINTKNTDKNYSQKPQITVTAKKQYFNADHSNVPTTKVPTTETNKQSNQRDISLLTEILSAEFDPKKEYFNADNSNEPCKQVSNSTPEFKNLQDRYEEVVLETIDDDFNPDVNLSSTYMWTEGVREEPDSPYFGKDTFMVNTYGEVLTHLMNGVEILTLMDTGASKTMLSKEFYDKHAFLHTYPKYKLPQPRVITCANGETMTISECIQMMIRIRGHVFEIFPYLVEQQISFYPLIIGQKTMYELEASLSFPKMQCKFVKRSKPLLFQETYEIQPGEAKDITLSIQGCPRDFTNGEAIIKLRTDRTDHLVQTLKVQVTRKKIHLQISNGDSQPLVLQKGSFSGIIDMRSVGYFHIRQDVLKTMMATHCKFLTEDETKEYFCHLMRDTRKIKEVALKAENTRLVDRVERDPVEEQPKDLSGDQWPWLEPDDPRRKLTDREIIEKYVNLEESHLSKKQKKHLLELIYKYRKAFSLRDEIGTCPDMEIELELNDTTPFFIRPFPCKESEKDIIDKEMRKGCLLGILKKGMSSYSSPIMLIPRKLTGIPRIVTDFRHLNSRLVTLQPSIPLVRDAIQILGNSGCEILSVLDLRDAYHTLRLSKRSQRFCGITPYYGSDTYLYQRLGMGLSISPAIWQNYIQRVLNSIPNWRKNFLAIMDDLLIHSKMKDHMKHLTILFKALIKHGLKISPKKCQLFRKSLVYMGHTMMIEDGLPKLTPLKSRVEAILKLDPPKTPKECRSFCGMVNYLSMFMKRLQLILIPIYQITRKGIPFYWADEQQQAFEEIKQILTNAPVLTMPRETGHLVLVSDTSKIGCGGALYQLIKGKYRLLGYHSKKLPDAASRYSISELELTGMLVNISAFKHILKNAKFSVYSDHSALVHIMNSKKELPTLRLKKLVEKLSDYAFTINFMKGKDLHVTDFLSRHPDNDTDDPTEVIPISFLAEEMDTHWDDDVLRWNTPVMSVRGLHVGRQLMSVPMIDFESHECDKCHVLTRSKTEQAKAKIPSMYPLKGEKRQPHKAQEGIIEIDTEVEDEVNGPYPSSKTSDDTQLKVRNKPTLLRQSPVVDPGIHSQVPAKKYTGFIKPFAPEVPELLQNPFSHVDLSDQLPPYDIGELWDSNNWTPGVEDVNKANVPLFTHLVDNKIFRKHIPKAGELDKFLESLKHKIIHDLHVPLAVKELRAEYPHSPFFKDIYTYITRGSCRFTGKAKKMFLSQCEEYFVAHGVLFKIVYTKKDKHEPKPLLCVPEKYIPTVLHKFHDSICAGHPGVVKLFEAVRQKYHFPGMFTICEQYVSCCHDCQSTKDKTDKVKVQYPRIPIDYIPMSRFSMDVKQMPPSKFGFSNLLVCTCEFTNWVEAFPMANQEAQTIADTLYFKIINRFGTPRTIICDEAPAFTSDLMRSFFHVLNINYYYVSPMNHGSLRTERYIRTLNDIITKHLEGTADDWPLYVQPVCFTMNCQISMVTGFSPYEMVYKMKPPSLWQWEFNPEYSQYKVSTSKYMDLMNQRKEFLHELILRRKTIESQTQYIKEMRNNPNHRTFKVSDLVYLYFPSGAKLQAPSRKMKRNWIGPMRIMTILDDTHYLIGDMQGKMPEAKVHYHRLKPFFLNLNHINDEGILQVVSNYNQILEQWRILLKDGELLEEWAKPNLNILHLALNTSNECEVPVKDANLKPVKCRKGQAIDATAFTLALSKS